MYGDNTLELIHSDLVCAQESNFASSVFFIYIDKQLFAPNFAYDERYDEQQEPSFAAIKSLSISPSHLAIFITEARVFSASLYLWQK